MLQEGIFVLNIWFVTQTASKVIQNSFNPRHPGKVWTHRICNGCIQDWNVC